VSADRAAPLVGDHRAPGGFVDLGGERCYLIEGYDSMPPFFMTVVGASDVWLFISSSGGLTAGRGRPDNALFPYYTDDKVTENASNTGGLTVIRARNRAGLVMPWQPFAACGPSRPDVHRRLFKSTLGDSLTFEETDEALGLRLRVRWRTSERFGVVRDCELSSSDGAPHRVDIVDGLVNILPPGVTSRVQTELSNLLDAYKRNEVDPTTGLGLFSLSSNLTDLAEPSEALTASVAWQVGLPAAHHLLSTAQQAAVRDGLPTHPERDVRGRRGAYLVAATRQLGPGETVRWRVVADVGLDGAQVVAVRRALRDPVALSEAVDADLERGRDHLTRLIAAADGLQHTGDETATVHHLANVLFNAMRGGVPAAGDLSRMDFLSFLGQRSRAVLERRDEELSGLPETLTVAGLIAWADLSGDPDLRRLSREYLPLTFSRRHGDPSRPWNRFDIRVTDPQGQPWLDYQGNWRDIFQNWEALSWSYPELIEGFISTFLDATTIDGYNPYRISRSGVDWEVPEPENPWSNIGYWGDHQIVYLLRLMETSARFHPGRLAALLHERIFTYAAVPYRIASYPATVLNPYDTIEFDAAQDRETRRRVSADGADALLVHDHDGELERATLAEKLLLLLAAKLVNLVPGGGIWMNTQRPEWNDANNALVGRGLSVVTLAHLRRYLVHLQSLLVSEVALSREVADLLKGIHEVLADPASDAATTDDARRRDVLDALGAAGTAYRDRAYRGLSGERTTMSLAEVRDLLAVALAHADESLGANRRPDGLYHSYNTLSLTDGRAVVGHLAQMLEGQVAVLSSGLLGAEESRDLLKALRQSPLYRSDQRSYQLYPDKDLPGFLDRNRFGADVAAGCPLVASLIDCGDRALLVKDVEGDFHFGASIRKAEDLRAALDRYAADPAYAEAVRRDGPRLLEIFEEVFHHRDFTGRSGTFFAYEGLGSVYWHMVSKLLLAAQEAVEGALAAGAPPEVVAALATSYEEIRSGLGYCKTPERYGAFPTDPYSHTPAGGGARQPGMTGQVKEEVITRMGELGLRVEDGQIVFRPALLREQEWTTAPAQVQAMDLGTLPAGSLAFSFCQVPVIYTRAETLHVEAHLRDGTVVECPHGRLPADLSASIFRRVGDVRSIRVRTPAGRRPAENAPLA